MSCELCGGPVSKNNRYGICNKTIECRREYNSRWNRKKAEKLKEKYDGATTYQGDPCPNGHSGIRWTCTGGCVECSYQKHKDFKATNPGYDRMEYQKYYTRHVLGGARRRAKKKGVPFKLTKNTLPEIPEVCPACDCKLLHSWDDESKTNSPSLDRIIPALGYVPGNVAWLCYRCNTIKQDATADEIRAVANWLDQVSNSASSTSLALELAEGIT